jgi:hypothetical protein
VKCEFLKMERFSTPNPGVFRLFRPTVARAPGPVITYLAVVSTGV